MIPFYLDFTIIIYIKKLFDILSLKTIISQQTEESKIKSI